MSDWIQKAKDFVKGHPEQAEQGLDKAEELINEKTGGSYADKVDQGTDALKEQLGLPADGPSEIPAPPTTGDQDLPGVPNPNLPSTGEGDITLGDPPKQT